MRRMPSWFEKIETRNYPADFCIRNLFWGGVSRHAATPLIVALSPGHSDTTRFRPSSLIATGNHLGRAEKIPNVAQTTGTVDVFDPRSGISGSTSWMMDPTRSREILCCSAIDLAEIQWSSKISSWIPSIISGVVTVFSRPGRGASQVEKSPRLNWATQLLPVAHDGARSPNVSFRMAWIFFGALPCRKIKTIWQFGSPCC